MEKYKELALDIKEDIDFMNYTADIEMMYGFYISASDKLKDLYTLNEHRIEDIETDLVNSIVDKYENL